MLVHGVKYTKLLNIPLDHLVVDELHLMLTVTDIFIGNLAKQKQHQLWLQSGQSLQKFTKSSMTRTLRKTPQNFSWKPKNRFLFLSVLMAKEKGMREPELPHTCTSWYTHSQVLWAPQISQNIYRARGWKEQWCSSCNNSEKVQQVGFCRRCSATIAMSVGA